MFDYIAHELRAQRHHHLPGLACGTGIHIYPWYHCGQTRWLSSYQVSCSCFEHVASDTLSPPPQPPLTLSSSASFPSTVKHHFPKELGSNKIMDMKSGYVPTPLSTGWCQVIVKYYYLFSGGWGHQTGSQGPVGKKIPGPKMHSKRAGPETV